MKFEIKLNVAFDFSRCLFIFLTNSSFASFADSSPEKEQNSPGIQPAAATPVTPFRPWETVTTTATTDLTRHFLYMTPPGCPVSSYYAGLVLPVLYSQGSAQGRRVNFN